MEADRGAASLAAGELGHRGEREAVPAHRHSSRDHERDNDGAGRGAEDGRRRRQRRECGEPDEAKGPDTVANHIAPPSQCDSKHHRECLDPRQHQRRLLRREATLVVEVEDEEPRDRDLSDEVEPGGRPDRPRAAVREHPPRLAGPATAGDVPHDRSTDDRARERQAGEKEKRALEARAAFDRRQRESGDRGTERRRGLADAERKPTFTGPEPGHHRAAARRVDAGTCAAGGPEEHDDRWEARRERDRSREGRADAETRSEDAPLADAVGQQAPRQKSPDRPDPWRGDYDSDLGEAQAEIVAQGRGQDGRRCQEREISSLGACPGGEDRPPIPAHGARRRRYRPNGLNGFGLVETRTLFVSRYRSSVSSPSSRPKPDCL